MSGEHVSSNDLVARDVIGGRKYVSIKSCARGIEARTPASLTTVKAPRHQLERVNHEKIGNDSRVSDNDIVSPTKEYRTVELGVRSLSFITFASTAASSHGGGMGAGGIEAGDRRCALVAAVERGEKSAAKFFARK